jgi:hypothetical protein
MPSFSTLLVPFLSSPRSAIHGGAAGSVGVEPSIVAFGHVGKIADLAINRNAKLEKRG